MYGFPNQNLTKPSIAGCASGAIFPAVSTTSEWGVTVYPLGVRNNASVQTGNPVNNFVHCMPFMLGVTRTLDQLSMNVSSAGAANGSRTVLGVYEPKTNLYPGRLLLATLPVATDTNGVKTDASFPPTILQAGQLYYVAWTSTIGVGTSTTITAGFAGDNVGPYVFGTADASMPVQSYTTIRISRTYDGTLPQNFPTGATRSQDLVPIICGRFSA